MIIRIRVVLSLLILIHSFAWAQQTDTEKLHHLVTQFLREYSQEEHISAVAVTVKSPRHDIPISVYAGTMGIHQQNPIDANSLFQIGSVSKSFITTILLKLESDPSYHFNINDPITKFFPQYKKWHSVTIKQLMNMSSGIPDYIIPEIVESFTANPYVHHDKKSWINYIYQKPLLFSPGTRYGYSNTNYFLLGLVIEKLTGHTLTDEIKNRIIIPFQLTHTHYIPHKPKATLTPYLVHGYQNENGFMDYIPRGTDVTKYSLSYMGAAGGVISTSEDIARWTHALFTPGKVLTHSQFKKMIAIISQKTGQHTQQLSAKDPLGFGLGIRVQYSPILKNSYYIYQGMTFGYRAIYFYIPARDTLIAITVNSSFDGKENHLIGLINQIGEKIAA
jgi:D-alanyl-D-alanine carboxypeptidase